MGGDWAHDLSTSPYIRGLKYLALVLRHITHFRSISKRTSEYSLVGIISFGRVWIFAPGSCMIVVFF